MMMGVQARVPDSVKQVTEKQEIQRVYHKRRPKEPLAEVKQNGRSMTVVSGQ